jgi:hypothetical protein
MTHISQGTPKLKLNSIHHDTLRGPGFLSLGIGRVVISLPIVFVVTAKNIIETKENTSPFCKLFGIGWL